MQQQFAQQIPQWWEPHHMRYRFVNLAHFLDTPAYELCAAKHDETALLQRRANFAHAIESHVENTPDGWTLRWAQNNVADHK